MTCFSPLSAWKVRSKTADKGVGFVFSPSKGNLPGVINLPCGQCVGCRLERSRQWAVRCMHEAQMYEDNCFITLTYAPENVPAGGSLVKSDFQDFMKRLRKAHGAGIRYYMCGEYGEKFERPHYHALLFNHDFNDKQIWSSKNGNRLYISSELSRLWPQGFSTIGDVTFESASYVARYCMKKVTGVRAKEHYDGRTPEYSTMSRGSKKIGTGGIGKAWFDKYKAEVIAHDGVIVRGVVSRPPRYYDTLLGRQDPSTLELAKIEREKNGQRFVGDVLSDGRRVFVSDFSGPRLLVREQVKLAQISTLKRPLEEI